MEDNRTEKRIIGDMGEDIACKYLEKNNYKIVERNFNCKIGEIDIIAHHSMDNILAIVEVKTRNDYKLGYPCEFVNGRKQRLIKRTYEYYVLLNPSYRTYQVCFDIIEILMLQKGIYIRHLKNAF